MLHQMNIDWKHIKSFATEANLMKRIAEIGHPDLPKACECPRE